MKWGAALGGLPFEGLNVGVPVVQGAIGGFGFVGGEQFGQEEGDDGPIAVFLKPSGRVAADAVILVGDAS